MRNEVFEGGERYEYLVGPVVQRGRVGRRYGTEHIGLDAAPREARGSSPQVKWGAARMLQLWARAPGPQHALIPEVHVDRVRLKTHTAVTRDPTSIRYKTQAYSIASREADGKSGATQ